MIRQLFKTVREKLHSLAKFAQRKPQQVPDHHHAKPVEESPLPPRKRNPRPERQPERPRWSLEQFPVPPQEGKTRFHDLNLPLSVMHAIADLEFQYCSPIQAEALPTTLQGNDLVGQAQTGTGKTAAFLIAILSQLHRQAQSGKRPAGVPKALILAPTRELAMQIGKDARALSKYMRVRIVEVFGGADYRKQQERLQESVDIVVATPGRLLDFYKQKVIKLDEVQFLVIDEADRMLDMGFIPDVKQIVYSTPHKDKRQTLFFSATFTDDVKRLAEQWTRVPTRVQIEPEQVASESIEQKVYIVTSEEKYPLLYNLITQQNLQRVMVFSNYRHETRSLNDRLRRDGIRCAMLSGDVPQNKRTKTLEDFRNGKIRVLVATDVAARGIHIEGVSHVVNFNLPQDPEDYVHRIGRTGRAGEKGISVSFACEEDSFYIPDIQAYLGEELKCVQPEAELLKAVPKAEPTPVVTPKPAAVPAEPTANSTSVETVSATEQMQSAQTQSADDASQTANKPRRRHPRRRHSGQRQHRSPRAQNPESP